MVVVLMVIMIVVVMMMIMMVMSNLRNTRTGTWLVELSPPGGNDVKRGTWKEALQEPD